MPAHNEANVRHLLRRTEFVDRQSRVDTLMGLGTIQACVDDVMTVSINPPSVTFTAPNDWERGVELTNFWMERMATTTKSFGERMAYFWHGHIPTEFNKAGGAYVMRDQIDLWRSDGLGNVAQLVKDMSIQGAMLRYLDNNQNFKESPNQNFARELMELFLLGVGNYTEADVEAATAAWTGHSADWETGVYQWLWERHETASQTFLGRTINAGSYQQAGNETIDVILGTGSVGTGTVPVGPRAGDDTDEVAADFLSKKLWQEFGEATTGGVPAGVGTAMRNALLDNDFDIRPWVRAMLLHDDFYTDSAKNGLVRQPVEYAIALIHATGLPVEDVSQLWLMNRAGQRLLYPPNVSGWRPNGYWVNASAMEARNRLVQGHSWRLHETYWVHDWNERYKNYLQFPVVNDDPGGDGRIHQHDIVGWNGTGGPAHQDPMSSADLVDRMIKLMDLETSASARQDVIDFCEAVEVWNRNEAFMLLLIAPEMHVA